MLNLIHDPEYFPEDDSPELLQTDLSEAQERLRDALDDIVRLSAALGKAAVASASSTAPKAKPKRKSKTKRKPSA